MPIASVIASSASDATRTCTDRPTASIASSGSGRKSSVTSWLRASAYMLMPNPLIIARIAPSMTPITSSAWFSVHSSAASAAGAWAGIGVCSAPVARTKIHSAATTMPIATTTSVAIRSRISPGSVESSQSSSARQRLFCCGAGRSS